MIRRPLPPRGRRPPPIFRTCASKWVNRHRRHGELGLEGRSSSPHHQPTATPPATAAQAALQAERLQQPTLVIATRDDGSVSYAHAQSLAETIPHARLFTSTAPSHMIWLSNDYPDIAAAITDFLTLSPEPPQP